MAQATALLLLILSCWIFHSSGQRLPELPNEEFTRGPEYNYDDYLYLVPTTTVGEDYYGDYYYDTTADEALLDVSTTRAASTTTGSAPTTTGGTPTTTRGAPTTTRGAPTTTPTTTAGVTGAGAQSTSTVTSSAAPMLTSCRPCSAAASIKDDDDDDDGLARGLFAGMRTSMFVKNVASD